LTKVHLWHYWQDLQARSESRSHLQIEKTEANNAESVTTSDDNIFHPRHYWQDLQARSKSRSHLQIEKN
jgi:hypothetical protein